MKKQYSIDVKPGYTNSLEDDAAYICDCFGGNPKTLRITPTDEVGPIFAAFTLLMSPRDYFSIEGVNTHHVADDEPSFEDLDQTFQFLCAVIGSFSSSFDFYKQILFQVRHYSLLTGILIRVSTSWSLSKDLRNLPRISPWTWFLTETSSWIHSATKLLIDAMFLFTAGKKTVIKKLF